MTNKHTFYEFHDLAPGVTDIDELNNAIDSDQVTAYVFGGDLVKFVKGLLKMPPVTQLKNCRFAFDNGKRFVEIDRNGKIKEFEEGQIPDWFQTPNEFARGQWLKNHDFADLLTQEFIAEFISRFPLKERREHANLLFDLELSKIGTTPAYSPGRKLGNTSGKTTKPKVTDLQSLDLFTQFFDRLKGAVFADEFPSLQVLTGYDSTTEAPATLKGAVRTWFKGITGQLPPNNKKINAGHPEVFCAPIKEQIQYIEENGLENFYHGLARAISDAGEDTLIADFSYSYRPD